MKTVILIFFNVLIPLIHGDDDARCQHDYGGTSYTVCFENSELVHVNGSQHGANMVIDEPLESIAPNAFKNTSIWYLSFGLHQRRSGNNSVDPLRIQPKSFRGLQQLKSLGIYNGILNLEHNIFVALESLEILFFSACKITFAKDGSFTGLPKLKTLLIQFSEKFEMQPGIFTGLDELENLQLYRIGFTIVRKKIFNHMKHLRQLDLSNNEISVIEAGAFDGMSIEYLVLDCNKLTVIPIGVFDGASINQLRLYENQIVRIEPNAFGNSTVKELRYNGKYITIDKQLVGLGESTVLKGNLEG